MSYPTALPLDQISLDHGFLADRARLVRETVIPWQWEALNDRIPGAERSGCVHNLQVAAGEKVGEFHGLFWQDSDLAKWIEAASYRLGTHPNPALDAELDRTIATIAKAQRDDGYLNTYFQLVEPDKRWANLRDCHELYVAGHFIEAGVAHFEATGKRTLLDVVCKLADMIDQTFGPQPDQIPGYCGHEEIELALVKLARATGVRRYIDLAGYFISQRGRSPNYFEEEARRRGDKELPWHMHHDGLATLQAARPVSELDEPVGHAVRMMYLLAAMIDLAVERSDVALAEQSRRLWKAIVGRHLYITGGVGSEPHGEKFCEPFDLPPDRAYAETCAGIGVVMCARRMLELELDGSHADVMERALLNNVLAGLALDGRTFFYVNPLEVVPAVAKRRHDTHLVKTQRVPWFGCACCPPNVARLLASIGDYACSRVADGIALHLYFGGSVAIELGGTEVRLAIRTRYPWEGRVEIEFESASVTEFTLHLRVPGWCRALLLEVNGVETRIEAVSGYARVRRRWGRGDRIVLDLPMPVERVRADPRVTSAAGQVALQRGPIVYCVEEIDNGPILAALSLPRGATLEARFDSDLLNGCAVVEGEALRTPAADALYSTEAPIPVPVHFRAVPYALWANRGEGEMRVWLRES
ncbi:MAG TPA: beta-L-arabinofuranosidase domain-containing protein [Opitutaceae bacterium]|nr:beta-L-arabinofuranosidase domain-containing protein [Opitutaceae bacterium]